MPCCSARLISAPRRPVSPSLSHLINATRGPASPPVRIVLPAVLCRSDSSPEMCICITCHSQGGMPCAVWLTSGSAHGEGGRLSHGSVRQNMCEQKWGHLGRIRNCEDEERGERKNKNKTAWVEFCSPVCARAYLTEHQWLLMCAFACIPECISACKDEGQTVRFSFFFFLLVPHLMFPSQDKHPSRKWQVHRCGLTGLICRSLHAVWNHRVH